MKDQALSTTQKVRYFAESYLQNRMVFALLNDYVFNNKSTVTQSPFISDGGHHSGCHPQLQPINHSFPTTLHLKQAAKFMTTNPLTWKCRTLLCSRNANDNTRGIR